MAVEPETEHGIGVARFIRSPDDPEVAEVAVAVADSWQGSGVATALLGRLSERARAEGVRRFSAEILAENRPMLELIEEVGDVTMPTATTAASRSSWSCRPRESGRRCARRCGRPRARTCCACRSCGLRRARRPAPEPDATRLAIAQLCGQVHARSSSGRVSLAGGVPEPAGALRAWPPPPGPAAAGRRSTARSPRGSAAARRPFRSSTCSSRMATPSASATTGFT